MSRLKSFIILFALAGAWLVPQAARANLLTNGDFSAGGTGWTSDWTISSATASTTCGGPTCISGGITSGSFLYQDIATTPGALYDVSFKFQAFGGNPMELQVLLGNTLVADFLNQGFINPTVFSFSGIAASGSTTRLLFLGRNDPGINFLNDVSVVPEATPEPASVALAATGLLVLAGFTRKRQPALSR